MSRQVPSPPHYDSGLIDRAMRMTREWYDWVDKFFRAINYNTPLTGTATFAAATSAAVTFDTAEAGTSYNIHIDSPANLTFWVTSKATTGFTINSSSSTSVTVGWTLTRR